MRCKDYMKVLIKNSKDQTKSAPGDFYGFAKTNDKIVAVVQFKGYQQLS